MLLNPKTRIPEGRLLRSRFYVTSQKTVAKETTPTQKAFGWTLTQSPAEKNLHDPTCSCGRGVLLCTTLYLQRLRHLYTFCKVSGDCHATRFYSSQCLTSTTYEKSADKQTQKQLEMADCVTRVELHVSCRGLLDKDTTSKSDPLCAMCIQDAHGKWVEVGVPRSLLRDTTYYP